MFAADLAERQAAADDFQADAVFFDVGTAQVRIGQPLFAGKFDVVGFAAADGLFLLGHTDAVPFFQVVQVLLQHHIAAARAFPFGNDADGGDFFVAVRVFCAVHKAV